VQRQRDLERQRRSAQARFLGEYLQHLRDQQNRYRDDYDYYNDPYFYTAPTYRYYRSGRYYQVNQYAVNYLQQAINDGYELGFRSGQADREDRWRYGYTTHYAYEDASYGYPGYYLGFSEYQYYFRQGFRRGYEDGYYGRYRYGRYDNGKYEIFVNILSLILRLQPLR